MPMNDKFIENFYIVLYALLDVWNAFKNVVFVVCSCFSIWLIYTKTNLMITISLFLLIPILFGAIWARLYKDAFKRGAVKLEDIEKYNKEDK